MSGIHLAEKRPRVPAPNQGASKAVSVVLVQARELHLYRAAWEALAGSSEICNVFYEPHVLMPAIEHIGRADDLRFLFVFGPQVRGERPLWGFFPLQIQTRCLHLPIRTLAFWQHRYCYLAVPLIAAGQLEPVCDAFWRWFERNPLSCHLLDTNYLPVEGAFHAAWAECLIGRSTLTLNEHTRGLQKRAANFETYVSGLLSHKRYHAFCRARRHLESSGRLEYSEVRSAADVDVWVNQFLTLEASGWKGGAAGDAIAKEPRDERYFREMTHAAFHRGGVRLISLELNGKPVAMKHVLLTADSGFIFKIAYDEKYAKFSPGVLLELEHLRQWHAGFETECMDTCTEPRHSLFNLISNRRRVIRRTLISNGSRWGDFLVSSLPLLRWLRHQLNPNALPEYFRVRRPESKADISINGVDQQP